MMKHIRIIVLVAAFAPALALADWADDFDSYATGSQLHGQGGWKGWDNVEGAGAFTTDKYALSSPNSVDINGPTDLVHEYTGYDKGTWTYTAWQYIPSSLNSGTTYFILLNTYKDGGPNSWSIQLPFDLGRNNNVTDDYVSGETPITLVRDAWIEIRVEIDLDNDAREVFYNGTSLSKAKWTVQGGDAKLNIAAVDLYANGAGSVYYDDLSLVPEPTTALLALLGAAALLRRR
jgi:hypothetical protein